VTQPVTAQRRVLPANVSGSYQTDAALLPDGPGVPPNVDTMLVVGAYSATYQVY